MLKSIYTRTVLLVLIAVLAAQGISLMVPADRSPPELPVRLEDVARQLRPRDGSRPPEFNGDQPPGFAQDRPPPDGRSRPPFDPDDYSQPGMPPRDAAGFGMRTMAGEPLAGALTAMPELSAELALLVGVPVDGVRVYATNGSLPLRQPFLAAIRQTDGHWRIAERTTPTFPSAQQRRAAEILVLALLALLPLAWLYARTLSAPMRRLTDAARGLGQDGGSAPLPLEGPQEMQVAIASFNAMQARLNSLLESRTRMVGAIAHDLRTPLTRLAFRLDDLPDPLHAKVHNDIDEMKSMISAALEFIRDRSLKMPRERLDLRLLVERVVNDLADLGHDVTLQAGSPITVEGAPLALRRMVNNVLENALKYGQRARVRLAVQDTRCTLDADDDGPGIPEALHEQVFEPFFRVESSRNRDTGGIGLGLSAVRAIAIEHGGEVRLGNRKDGGLRVTLFLPLAVS